MHAKASPQEHLGVIGSGVMAEAIIAGLLGGHLFPPQAITCADPREERRDHLASHYGVTTSSDNVVTASGADVVILAVKPQVLPEVLRQLHGRLRPGALLLSIVAGAGSRCLRAATDHRRIVRAMPNTPAQIGAGITVWFATPEVDPDQRARTRDILDALGDDVEVSDERQIGMATAVSGSGPAYTFLFMEALIDSAVQLGLTRPMAQEIVVSTVRGSAALATGSDRHIAELRNRVTSPGGTSAAGLHRMEAGALRGVVADAVRAAYERELELEALCDEEAKDASPDRDRIA